jgi:OPA family glycerol-3-phosphate transporter-like MFS transporter
MSDPALARWQRVTLATLLVGYAGYYLCRSNFSVSLPLIAAELAGGGLEPARARSALGAVASAGVLAYALGKFASGVAAERIGGRRAFLGGMALSALCTLAFAASGTLPLFSAAWVANRLVQSMGWVGMVKIASRWFHASAYGTAMGVVSLSYLFGDAIARGAMGALLAAGFGWRALFAIAAAALLAILAASAWLLRESPAECGVEEPAAAPGALLAAEREHADPPQPGALLHALWASRPFRLVCAISLGLTLLRETFNTWTPTYFVEAVGLAPDRAAAASAIFPFLGGVAVLWTGWLSDRAAGRGTLLFAGVALASAALFALALAGIGPAWRSIALVGVTGFLLIGPYSLLAGAISLDFGGKRASAAAAGVIDGVGYLGGVLAGGGVAGLAERFGWSGAFLALAGVASATAFLAWRFRAAR